LAPPLGILVGDYLDGRIGSTADCVGASTLGTYGVYLIVQAYRNRRRTSEISAVVMPNRGGASQGEYPSRPTLVRDEVVHAHRHRKAEQGASAADLQRPPTPLLTPPF
jgi:hypothetical protein